MANPVNVTIHLLVSNDGKVQDALLGDGYGIDTRVSMLNEQFEGTERKWSALKLGIELTKEHLDLAFSKPPSDATIPTRFSISKWLRW